MYSKLVILTIAVIGLMICTVPSQSYALCDQGNVRVVEVDSTPYNNANTNKVYVWVSSNAVLPTFYYYFATSNQMFINMLDAAHAGNLQVRVTGDAASCPTSGTQRYGGTIVAVFRSSFF